MIETIREEEEQKLMDMKSNFDSNREETKNKNVEDLEQMKSDLIRKIELLDKQFSNTFSKYCSETHQKAKEYDKLIQLNANDSKDINNYQRKINRLRE
jgi:DNA anti-recombination protein RmuC